MQPPEPVGHEHALGLLRLSGRAQRGAVSDREQVLVREVVLHDVEHRLASRRIRVRRDHRGEVQLPFADAGSRVRAELLEVLDQRIHVGIAQREARHQRAQRPALRVEPFADRSRQRRVGVGIPVAVHPRDVRQHGLLGVGLARVEQVCAGNRRDRHIQVVPLVGAEPAALVAADAGGGGARGSQPRGLPLSLERGAGRQDPAQVDRLARAGLRRQRVHADSGQREQRAAGRKE